MKRALPLVALAIALAPVAAKADDVPVYDIGTLSFAGSGTPAVPSYDIGTLTFSGTPSQAPPNYAVGTLIFRGEPAAAPPVYAIGTLVFRGKGGIRVHLPPSTQTPSIDIGKIFGLPPAATTTAPPVASSPPSDATPTMRKYILRQHAQTPALNSDLH